MWRKKALLITGIVVILGVIFFLVSWSTRGGLVKTTLRPFTAIGRGFLRVPNFFEARNYLRAENEKLRDAVARLAVDHAELERKTEELEELQALLDYQEIPRENRITARVVSYTRDPFTATLIIDRGSEDGLEEDAPVIVRDGIFIGRVERVRERSATVLLALDPRSKVGARIVGREGGLGVLEGHNVLYRLTLIPREVEFSQNDVVVTEPFEFMGSRQFVLGTVIGIEEDPNSPFKTAVVEPLVPLDQILFVDVIK